MLTIRNAFPGIAVGYSDHTLGIEVPIAAVAMGATIIEKHFTLNRNLPGPDHRASLEPRELSAMISGIRNIEKALGTGIKKPSSSELKNMSVARKSIVAASDIKKGETFTEINITVKRPGTGLRSQCPRITIRHLVSALIRRSPSVLSSKTIVIPGRVST